MAYTTKKIVYVITKSVWGGAQRYVFDLATHLPKNLYAPMVITGERGLMAEKLEKAGIPVHSLKTLERDLNIIKECIVFFQLFFFFFRERPAIIHLNSSKIGALGSLSALFANVFRKKSEKARVVFTAHGWAFHEDRAWLSKKIIILISRFSALFQDAVIIISERDFDSALQISIPENKLSFIRLGIASDNAFISPLDAERILSEISGERFTRPLLGVIAELTKNKGLPYLIQALHILKKRGDQFSCVIIGDGEEKKNLQMMIDKNGMKKNIFLAGFLENASFYLQAFDFFVLPSIKEGFPYVLLEAGCAGLAVIATRIGGIPDIIQQNENGLLVPPKNPERLAAAIHKLIWSKDLRLSLAKNASKNIEKFSFERMLEETIALYQKLTVQI